MTNQYNLGDLAAPVKSFRLFILEWAIREGASADLLQALRDREREEDDEECRALLGYALEAVQKRLGGALPSPISDRDSLKDFPETFAKAPPGRRLELLSALSETSRGILAPAAPQLLAVETDPAVAGMLLRTFAGKWPADHLVSLQAMLASKYLSVRMAAIDALLLAAPHLLEADLPALLLSGDPRLRSLAIQALARIDPEAALEHLEAMLGEAEPHSRICALQSFLHLPFERVKPILIRFLAAETDLDRLRMAALHFEINPDPQVPFQLWELLESAPSGKAAVLRKAFDGAVGALEHSGLLGQEGPAFRERLQTWVRKRTVAHRVWQLLAEAALNQDLEVIDPASPRLRDLETALVLETFREAMTLGLSPEIRERLGSLIGGSAAAITPSPSVPAATPPGTSAPDRFSLTGRSPDEVIRLVASWKGGEGERARPLLKDLIQDRKASPEVRAVALRAATRLELREFAAAAEACLGSQDERLSAAALDYLGRFDPDRVFPTLGVYLASSSLRLKSLGLNILKRYDPPRALSIIDAMLNGAATAQQASGMACLVQFEFALVRPRLVSFLARNHSPDLLAQGLALFRANPDVDNLYALFRLERLIHSELAPEVARTRSQVEQHLVELGLLTAPSLAELTGGFGKQFDVETARAKAPSAPYALKKLRPGEAGAGGQDAGRWWGIQPQVLWMVALSMVVGCFLFWVTASIGEGPGSRPDQAGPVLAKAATVGGVVDSAQPDGGLLFKADEGPKILLLPDGNRFAGLQKGDRLIVTLVPFRFTPEGIVVAQVQSLQKP